jgi:cell division protein FtsQ
MSPLAFFKRTKKSSTRRKKPVRFNWRKWALRGVIVFVALWAVLIALAANLPERAKNAAVKGFYQASAASGFQLKQIALTGRTHTDPQNVRRLIPLDRGESIFALDLDVLHEQILMLPWVKSAALRRDWPDLLSVHLVEYTPLALWQHDGQVRILNENGDVIHAQLKESFSTLPILIGPDAPGEAAAFLQMIRAEPLIAEEFDSAQRMGERRWDVYLKNGMVLKLPEDDLPFALARIAEAQRKYLIFSKEILSLDARFSDRLIVKASSGAASRLSDVLSSDPSIDTSSVSR